MTTNNTNNNFRKNIFAGMIPGTLIGLPVILSCYHSYRGIPKFPCTAMASRIMIGTGGLTIGSMIIAYDLPYPVADMTQFRIFSGCLLIACTSLFVFLPMASYHGTSLLLRQIPNITSMLRLYKK